MSHDLADGIAEQVMGWELKRIPWAYDLDTQCWHEDNVALMTRDAWRPHEDETQNVMVLERLTALGFGLTLNVTSNDCQIVIVDANGKQVKVSNACRRLALLHAALEIMSS